MQSKSTGEIIRTLLVFQACKSKLLVSNADSLLKLSKKVFGSTLTNFVVGNTFYKQFVAGPDAERIKPRLEYLQSNGIHAILDYAAEDDVQAEEGPKSREAPQNTVVARTYSYEGERQCDKRMDIFKKAIEAAHSSDGQGFAAIKVTALGLPKLLERVSTSLVSINNLFKQLDEDNNGYLDPEEFRRVYTRLFSDATEERMAEVFDYLDTDHDGRVDYIAFTKGVTVRDGAAIARRCKEQGPFAKAALDAEEIRLLDNTIKRVDTLAEMAESAHVRLMVDAEHSYFQPAIDSIVAQLQARHNTEHPVIYNTYQCYLKDVHSRLTVDLEKSRREGWKFGCKLVRGAYLVLERQRAKQMGYESPVLDTIEQTHDSYDRAVSELLHQVKTAGAEVMVASHNQKSVEKTVAGMAALDLNPRSGVYFGQLLGMSDHLTFILGANGYGAYKYVPFGQVDEVMPYLVRRAQENSDILGGVGVETSMLRTELKRRLFG